MSNCDLRETTDIKIKLVLNILAFLDILDLFRSHGCTFSMTQWPGLTQDIQNSDKFRTLAYSEPCHIHNLHILRTLVCTELWYTWSHSQTSSTIYYLLKVTSYFIFHMFYFQTNLCSSQHLALQHIKRSHPKTRDPCSAYENP